MADAGNGPVGLKSNRPAIDAGTLAVTATPSPSANSDEGRDAFDVAIDMLRAEVANAGAIGAVDGAARAKYDTLARQYRSETQALVRAGKLTWREAAEQAHGLRNEVMAAIRRRSTPVGRAFAEWLKREGRTLNELIGRKTLQLFGEHADFNALSALQKDRVYAAIVESAGKSDPAVTATMRRVSRAGRGLLLLSVGISVYTIATADNKTEAAKREGAVTGAGIVGGIAGGAVAGLACGPGAPVCVTIGAFVGGALAALGVDLLW